MTTTTETKPWDFSHVLDFLGANTSPPSAAATAIATPTAAIATPPPAAGGIAPRTPGRSANGSGTADKPDDDYPFDAVALGDFSQVWQFLGVPKASSAAAPHNEHVPHILPKNDYASDGAAYTYKSKVSNDVELQWSDGHGGNGSDSATSTKTPLTKTQRKRARKKERKEREQAFPFLPVSSGTVSESEVDHITKQSAAKKASTHVLSPKLSEPQQRGKKSFVHDDVENATPSFKKDPPQNKVANMVLRSGKVLSGESPSCEGAAAVDAPIGNTVMQTPQQKVTAVQQTNGASTPNRSRAPNLIPASLPPMQTGISSTPIRPKANNVAPNTPATGNGITPSGQQPIPPQHPANVSQPPVPSHTPSRKAKAPLVIEPRIIRSGADRHWALLLKLLIVFQEDRDNLVNPANLVTHNNHPDGIHLFVDASNILVGFNDALKRARGIPPQHHLPQAKLSFDGLALLMERRRPVARRVLVGSTPHLPEFDKAAAVGYDCSLLEKVHKSRLLTERQIHFRQLDARRSGGRLKMVPGPVPLFGTLFPAPSSSKGVDGGSGSETNTALYDPPKMIEQGVDEILHLKMLESIVDAEKPSTMVLATGDAAAAEYSDGFLAMVERALKKGWTVELVSWSRSISSMYTKLSKRAMWGDQFRIVYLDDFAEELLDM